MMPCLSPNRCSVCPAELLLGMCLGCVGEEGLGGVCMSVLSLLTMEIVSKYKSMYTSRAELRH